MFDMDKADRECEEMLHGDKKPLHPDTIHKTYEKPVVAVSKNATTTTANTAKAAQKPTEKPVEAQWEPVKEHSWMDNLKTCAIWAVGFGSLTFLFFSWQQAGLMDASVAVPTMLTCTALGGWGVGRNAMRGKR